MYVYPTLSGHVYLNVSQRLADLSIAGCKPNDDTNTYRTKFVLYFMRQTNEYKHFGNHVEHFYHNKIHRKGDVTLPKILDIVFQMGGGEGIFEVFHFWTFQMNDLGQIIEGILLPKRSMYLFCRILVSFWEYPMPSCWHRMTLNVHLLNTSSWRKVMRRKGSKESWRREATYKCSHSIIKQTTRI